MTMLELPPSLVEQVEFTDIDIARRLRFSPDLGFMAVDAGQDRLHIVGFHADEQQRDAIVPAIRLSDRPKECQVLNRNAKGVGLMLGNSPEAIDEMYAEAGRPARAVGLWMTPAYSTDYNRGEIANLSHSNPVSPLRLGQGIARHAWYIAQSKSRGLEPTIRSIEKRYGEANAAVIDPAPTWLLKQSRRGVTYPIVPPLWALYRDRQRRPLIKIGVYHP